MILILNKRLSISVLTLFFLMLILVLSHLPISVPAYAFLVNDWDTVGTGIRAQQVNMSFHLVSVPTGTKVRRTYGIDTWVEWITASPAGQIGIFEGVSNAFPQTGEMIQLWDGGIRTFLFDQPLRTPNVWSPDSAYLTTGIHNTCPCDRSKLIVDLGIINVSTGHLRELTEDAFISQDSRSVVWSPNGAALVYVDQQLDPARPYVEMVKWIPISGGQPARTLFTRTGAVTPGLWLRWLPDAQQIAVISAATPEIWFVDVQSAQVTFHYTAIAYFETCWSPITNHFIATSQTDFKLITPDGVPPLDVSFVDPSIWQQPSVLYDACAWSPDGKKIALIQANSSLAPIVQIIDIENRTTSEIQVNHKARFLIPFWSPDSRMLALKTYRPMLESGDTYIYDMSTLRQLLYQSQANFMLWLPQLP